MRSFFRSRWVRYPLLAVALLLASDGAHAQDHPPGIDDPPGEVRPDTVAVPYDALEEAIVYSTLRPPNWDVYLFEEPGGQPRRLTEDPALDYNAVFSPDGRWVVFTSERGGNVDLYALDLNGGSAPIRLTYDPAMDDAATFSPDGERLAFVSTRDGYADIFVMPFAPGDTTAEHRAVNLTRRPGGDFNPAFSPDGRHIAFSRQEHLFASPDAPDQDRAVELYIVDADGSNVRRLSEPGPGLPTLDGPGAAIPAVSGSPAWSSDGRTIYYYRLGADGFEIRSVAPDGSGDERVVLDGFSPAVGPDGRIGFVRSPSDAGPIAAFLPRSGGVMSVAADGSDLRAESSAIESCFAPNFDRASGRMLCHGPGPVDEPVRLDHGRAFAPPDAFRSIELSDRTVSVQGIRGEFPALTAAGDVVSTWPGIPTATTSAGSTETMAEPLQISHVDGSGMRELFEPPSGTTWGAAAAAGWLVVGVGPQFAPSTTRVDVWKVHLDGSDAENLTADSPANDALPHVSADGRRIAFRSGRDGDTWAVYVMNADGTDTRRVTDALATETMPALSPDGEWVVFATDEGDTRRGWFRRKLWLQRVDGPEGRLLEPDRSHIPDLSMHPRFSPDGAWVVFTSNRAGLNDEWPLTWFPQPYGEIWAAPVAGGPAVRLTHDKWEDGPSDWGTVRLPVASAHQASAPAPDSTRVSETLTGFLDAFNNLDWEAFRAYFDDEATVFHPLPVAPMRDDGGAEIEATFRPFFDHLRATQPGPPFLDLVPHDLRIQMFGNMAVVTFHLWPDASSIGRRTLVFREHDGHWLIVHLHASMAEQPMEE